MEKLKTQSKIWFTSDLHFSHKRIVEFTERGRYTDSDNHTDWLVNLWNSQVKAQDQVWHFGDFSFAKDEREIIAILKRLNGQKFFIKGNHDSSKHYKDLSKFQGCNLAKFLHYTEEDFVIQGQKQRFIMFHFPISSWHKQHYGSWMIHGHTHGQLREEFSKGKILDVGLDNSYKLYGKHTFFDLDMIAEYMHDRKIEIADSHRNEQFMKGEVR